jgi:hypothetical protein
VILVFKGNKVYRAILVFRDYRGYRVVKVILVLMVKRVILVRLA